MATVKEKEKDWRRLIIFWSVFVVIVLPFSAWTIRCNFLVMEIAEDLIKLQEVVRELPPDPFERRVENLEVWERENRAAHSRLEVGQERISTQLESQDTSLQKIETLVSKLHGPGG